LVGYILDRELDMVIALRNIVVPAPDVFGNIDHAKTLYLFVVCVLPMVPALRLRAKRRVSRNKSADFDMVHKNFI